MQDELEAELEELEEADLEEKLLEPTRVAAPAAPTHVPIAKQTARPAQEKNAPEEEELAALQAELAL